ncbi:MAG: acyl carrier protein [Candidatus Helarchaeota archaeon]
MAEAEINEIENKLKEIFLSIFDVDESEITDDFSPTINESWDSITHLMIITTCEDDFEIVFNEDDIPELNTFKKLKDEIIKLKGIN